MNTHTALFNLMPDSESAAAVTRRLNTLRAGARPSGSASPPSPFDALLKQAEAQAPNASELESSDARHGDETQADRRQDRIPGEDTRTLTSDGQTSEATALLPSADTGMLQGWPPGEGWAGAWALAIPGWPRSVPPDASTDAADTKGPDVSASDPGPGLGAQQTVWPEAGMPDGGTHGSLEARHSPMSVGAADEAAAGMPRVNGWAPTRTVDGLRSPDPTPDLGTPAVSSFKALHRGSAAETDSNLAIRGDSRVDQGESGFTAQVASEVRAAGVSPDGPARADATSKISAAGADPFMPDRLGEPVPPAMPGPGFQPAAPFKPDQAASRVTTAIAAPASTSRVSPPNRQNAAADYRAERGGEAADETMRLSVLQTGSGAAEEQRARPDQTGRPSATRVAGQPSIPSSSSPNQQMIAPASSADTLNFYRVLEQTQAAPQGYSAARLDTPLTDDAFPRVLGLQIGKWTDEGVQQVWLDVHPADMGPVAIQIALDGRQAELNFGAESAAARQVIEASLPELASALQAAGLTLSGGSISQDMPQARPGNEGMAPSGSRRSTASERTGSDAGAQAPTRAGRVRGLVDLYA